MNLTLEVVRLGLRRKLQLYDYQLITLIITKIAY